MSFMHEQTQVIIYAPLKASLSNGTMNPEHLLPVFSEALRDTPEYEALLLSPFGVTEDHLPELFDILDSYSPEGYYFGAHPGDGSDYGYWEIIED